MHTIAIIVEFFTKTITSSMVKTSFEALRTPQTQIHVDSHRSYRRDHAGAVATVASGPSDRRRTSGRTWNVTPLCVQRDGSRTAVGAGGQTHTGRSRWDVPGRRLYHRKHKRMSPTDFSAMHQHAVPAVGNARQDDCQHTEQRRHGLSRRHVRRRGTHGGSVPLRWSGGTTVGNRFYYADH